MDANFIAMELWAIGLKQTIESTLMNLLLKEIRHNPLLWLLAFVPVVFAATGSSPKRTRCFSCCPSWPSCPWRRC